MILWQSWRFVHLFILPTHFMCSLVLLLQFPLSIFLSFLFNYLPRTLGRSSIPTFNSVRDYILTRLSHIIWFQFHSKCGNSPAALAMNMVQVGCIMHSFFVEQFKQREINKLWKNMTWPAYEKDWSCARSLLEHHLNYCHYFCSWIASRYRLLNKNGMLNCHARIAAL